MIDLKLIKKLKSYGFVLSPAIYAPHDKNKDKKPKTKRGTDGKYHWSEDWSDEELVNSERIGIFHEPSSTYDIDFDDKSFVAHQFHSLLPDTFSIGKKYKGSAILTHKTYAKPNGANVKRWSYPKKVLNGSGKIIERLNKFTVIADQDRTIINDVKPLAADPEDILIRIKMIAAFAELYKHWPKAKKGLRDESYLRLTGALARETDIPINVQEEFIQRLCEITGDTEIKNRVNKVQYQHDQHKAGEEVYGIKELASYLGVNLPAFDILKREAEDEEDVKEYPLVDGHAFTKNIYPKTSFILEPIFSERSCNQIYGGYGSGKTLFGQAASMAMSSGQDFVGFKSKKKIPTLYVEGELPANDFRQRRDSILQNYYDTKKDFNHDWTFTLTRDDLELAGFKYGFDPIAVSRNLSDPEAKDYGRRGREHVANLIRRIEQKTGHKPFFFLDNITALADIDENRAPDWKPLIAWLIQEKNKGYPNCFVHHSNKQTSKGGSSGSNAKERLLDTSMSFEKLDEKHRFQIGGNKSVQCSVCFDKSRNFGGSGWDKTFILTMTEEGLWSRYPMLDKYDFQIIEGANRGLNVKDIKEEFELKIAEKTIYKRLKKLKADGIIKSKKEENNY